MTVRFARQAACALALAVILVGPVLAQEAMPGFTSQPTAPAAATATAQPAQEAVSASHMAAAIDYIVASESTKGFDEEIPALVNRIRAAYAQRRPEIATILHESAIAIVPEFVQKRGELNTRVGAFYAKFFSEEELKQLAQFYRSPLGQKLASSQFEIIKQSAPEIQKWREELVKAIDARLKDEVKKRGQAL